MEQWRLTQVERDFLVYYRWTVPADPEAADLEAMDLLQGVRISIRDALVSYLILRRQLLDIEGVATEVGLEIFNGPAIDEVALRRIREATTRSYTIRLLLVEHYKIIEGLLGIYGDPYGTVAPIDPYIQLQLLDTQSDTLQYRAQQLFN